MARFPTGVRDAQAKKSQRSPTSRAGQARFAKLENRPAMTPEQTQLVAR